MKLVKKSTGFFKDGQKARLPCLPVEQESASIFAEPWGRAEASHSSVVLRAMSGRVYSVARRKTLQ